MQSARKNVRGELISAHTVGGDPRRHSPEGLIFTQMRFAHPLGDAAPGRLIFDADFVNPCGSGQLNQASTEEEEGKLVKDSASVAKGAEGTANEMRRRRNGGRKEVGRVLEDTNGAIVL